MNANIGYGAWLDGKHTFKDYGLVVGNNDVVGEPRPKVNIIDIPGSSKRLDLTETLTGKPEYEGRQLKLVLGGMKGRDAWAEQYRRILMDLHGKRIKAVLDNDPLWYYEGRAELSGFDRVRDLGSFTLTLDAEAYKYEINASDEAWMKDIVTQAGGTLKSYESVSVSGNTSRRLSGSVIPVVPEFSITNLSNTADAYVTYNGTRYPLLAGLNRFAKLVIPAAGGVVYFYGNYTVEIRFRGGSL